MLGDLKDVGFGNFDPRVPKEISRALAGHLPVRMGRMILFKAPVSNGSSTALSLGVACVVCG